MDFPFIAKNCAFGAHRGISFAEYRSWDAINSTSLSVLWEKTPKHFLRFIADPPPPTREMRIGSAVHAITLSPESFDLDFVVGEKKDGDTRVVLSRTEFGRAVVLAAAIMDDWAARHAIEMDGDNELSLVWTDAATGLCCKARLDMYRPELSAIFDIKTSVDASPRAFSAAIERYGYHRQAAFYLRGAKACGIDAQEFGLIVAEKTPPFAVATYQIDQAAISRGVRETDDMLKRIKCCVDSMDWPGYQAFVGISI